MVHIGGIEELGDGGIRVGLVGWPCCAIVVKEIGISGSWAVVIKVSTISFIIGLSNTVVSSGNSVGGGSIILPCELRGGGVLWVGLNGTASKRWVRNLPRTTTWSEQN